MPDQDLKSVAARATVDKAFFDTLLKSPEQALAGAGITLSPAQLEKLKYALKNPASISVDMIKFIGALHSGSAEIVTKAIPPWGERKIDGGDKGGEH